MAIERLSGGLLPANGSDPRTFPAIWNDSASQIEQAVDDVASFEGRVTQLETDVSLLESEIQSLDTDDVAEGSNLYYTDARVLAVAAPLQFVENIVTSNYTLTISDSAKVIAFNSASNLTLTVPTNASVAFPLGTVVNVYRNGTGTVTIAGASGVTVRNAGTVPSQFGERSLRKRGTDEWVLV